MLQREFPGAEDLIRSVDAAVRAGSTAQVTDALPCAQLAIALRGCLEQ